MLYIAIGLLAVFLLFFSYRKFYCHRVFKRLGIPGPDPHWLFGNTLQIFREDRHLVIAKWSAQYGDFFGIYYGALPIIVTRSSEAVEKICVKQFSDFQGHMVWPITPDADKDPDHPQSHLFNSGGETWKRIHSILLPAFSTGKLKSFMPQIADSEDKLINLLQGKSKSGEVFDIKEHYQYLNLEIIGKVGVGVDFEVLKGGGKGNAIFRHIRAYLDAVANPPLFLYASMIFTELAGVFKFLMYNQMKFNTGFYGPIKQANAAVKYVVKQRRDSSCVKSSNYDILQQMIDVSTNQVSARSISEREITAQCFLLFTAGYETTSISLSLATYLLAENQQVQEKLVRELGKHFPVRSDGKLPEIDYETLMTKIPYLDWVCKETLRLYPPSMNLLSRYVVQDTTLCGISIPKSIWGVLVDSWSIHYDQQLWGTNTANFVPERFSPENSADRPDSSFLPFGFGPRICLGMRLALLIMKLTLANVLLRYKIVEPEEKLTKSSLNFSSRNGIVSIGDINVKLIPRSLPW